MVSFILPSTSQQQNMHRKEIQRSILQIATYLRKNEDGKTRNKKYRLAGPRDTSQKEKMV